MKAKSNISPLENLQQQSNLISYLNKIMTSENKKSIEVKLIEPAANEQSSSFALDLKRLLQAEQFQYNNLGPEGLTDTFVAMTPYMIGKIAKYRKACFFFKLDKCINSDQGFRDVALLLTLNSNLQPSILAMGIFKSQHVPPSQAVQQILKFVNQKSQINNMIIFCNQPESIQKTLEAYSSLYQKHIVVQPSFLYKENLMKQILMTTQMFKKPYLKKQAYQIINQVLEEKDEKKFYKQIQKFKEFNCQGFNKFINQQRKFKLTYQLPQSFFGFGLKKKYDSIIQNFVKKIEKQKYSNEIQFINRIIELQYRQMELKRAPCQDCCLIFEMNSRVKQLRLYIQPNPLNEFLQNYQKSLSFKHQKISQSKYLIGGKAGTAYQINKFQSNEWTCECGQTQRLGIPCQHLLKICCVQKLSFQDRIDSMYRIGHQKPFLRLD